MLPGQIPFVGSSSQSNGRTATIENTEHLHSGNTFTVSYNGSVGEVFYQPEPFWASDNVNVFYPRFQMSRSIALFCMTVIRKYGKHYNYAHKWTKERMEAERVSLPVTAEGEPDYAAMATLISAVEKRTIDRLSAWRKREREATARCITS